MGQYYRGVVLGKTTKRVKRIIVKQAYCCYAHNNGAKLMEHSYVGNWYVKAYEQALADEFYGYPFVWIGDYADEMFNTDVYTKANEFIDNVTKQNAKKKGYYPTKNNGNGYLAFEKLCNNGFVKKGDESDFVEKVITKDNADKVDTYKYIINFDKKVAVEIPEYNEDTWDIHPLPLLCASGNGRGGGDYSGINEEMVGAWAYDRIGLGNELPQGIKLEKIEFREC
jgi:hypothetical protein